MSSSSAAPTKYGVVLFPNFQLLDIAGPLDILNILAQSHKLSLSILSSTLQPVSTLPIIEGDCISPTFSQSIVPTHTFDEPPEDIEVLLVPGGRGARPEDNIRPAIDYVTRAYPRLKYLITVCTGSVLVAKAGVLDGKKATSNKKSWQWVVSTCPTVDWQPEARWVVDGNIWTSSGISAGMDVMYAFVEEMYGSETAQQIADASEYHRNTDPTHDPFAKRWGAV